MSGMVRIRAKAIQPARARDYAGYPLINGILPSWCDVQLFVVSEGGTEIPLTGVRAIKIEAKEGSEPLVATLECYLDEIDVLCERKEPAQ